MVCSTARLLYYRPSRSSFRGLSRRSPFNPFHRSLVATEKLFILSSLDCLLSPMMHACALARVFFVVGAFATSAQSLFPRGDNSTGHSNPSGTSPTLTQVTGSPQIIPNVPASQVVTGRYTLTQVPNQCTDSFVPYQTTFWAKQNQMNMEDAINPSWWGPKDPVDWTFSTNTSGVFFSEPSWIESGRSPAMNLKPRTKANSFTLNMDQSGKHASTID